MKAKYIMIPIIIALLWATNTSYLNKVSQSDKILNEKERELEILSRQYDSLIIEYDNKIDLEKIRKNLEKDGMKTTRELNYFKINEDEH